MRQDHSIFLPDSDEDRSRPPTRIEADNQHEAGYGAYARDTVPRPLNLRFLLVSIVLLIITTGSVHALHVYQLQHMSSDLLRQADEANAAGRHEEAAAKLRGYLRLEPEDADARDKLAFLLADVAETGSQRYELFMLLERILRDDPTRRDVRRRLVDLCMSVDRFVDAIAHLKLMIATAPDDDELYTLLARSYRAIGQDVAAAAAYQNAIRCAPRAFAVGEEFAELLAERLDELDRARNVMDEMVKSGTGSYEAYLARARFHQRAGQIESAETDAQRALHFGPGEPDVLQFVASLIAADGNRNRKFNVDNVYAELIRAEEQNPADVDLIVALAQLEAHRGRYDLAEQRLRAAISDDSEDLRLGWRLTEMLIAQSKLDSARQEMIRLEGLQLARPLEEYLAARVAMTDGQWLAAVRKFLSARNSAAAFPSLLPQINLCLGQCYARLGHVELQLAAFRDATRLNESSDEARLGLARSLARIGRIDDALLHYGQLQHVPGVDIQIAILLLNRNQQLPNSERNWGDVEQALDAAAKSDLENSLVVRSFMLVAQDQKTTALKLLERAIERHPGHVGLRIALAETHFQMDNLSEAESVLETARQKLGNRVEILLARIRYATALTGDAASARLQELEDLANQISGVPRTRVWRALAAAAAAIGDTSRWRTNLEAIAKKKSG